MSIPENLAAILARIDAARKAAIAPAPQTRLVAVSKTVSEAGMREAILAGQRLFGENRVQEAQGKFPPLKAEFPDLELHLIGPLQTNKSQRGRGAVRCHSDLGPRQARQRAWPPNATARANVRACSCK